MQIKKLALATLTVGVLGLAPLMVQAANDDLGTQLTEVRQESSIWTVIALDRHLNPFGIDVDVNNGVATLTGSVDTEHDRDLAAQLAQDTEGVKTVNNQLKLTPSDDAKQQKKPGLLQQMDDATQALCFMAGANSIFYGERLLTTDNPDADADDKLFARLGLKSI